jgi:hypothetical protein
MATRHRVNESALSELVRPPEELFKMEPTDLIRFD